MRLRKILTFYGYTTCRYTTCSMTTGRQVPLGDADKQQLGQRDIGLDPKFMVNDLAEC